MKSLETLDWIVIGIYFLVLLGIAVWVIMQKQKDTADYFLAGRDVGWFVVGASIFASNIGSEHVVGLAGTGASDKLPLLIYELHAWVVLMLGWVFCHSMPGVACLPCPSFWKNASILKPAGFYPSFRCWLISSPKFR